MVSPVTLAVVVLKLVTNPHGLVPGSPEFLIHVFWTLTQAPGNAIGKVTVVLPTAVDAFFPHWKMIPVDAHFHQPFAAFEALFGAAFALTFESTSALVYAPTLPAGIEIASEPSKFTPAMARAVASFVAVAALPDVL